MFTAVQKALAVTALTAAMAISITACTQNQDDATQQGDTTITFGWTAWADAEFVTKLARAVIENHWNYDVKLTLSAIALQFQGVASGDIDGMLMAWLPDTHAAYWKRYQDDVVDLGPLYEGARLGWVVPAYIPENQLASIQELHDQQVQTKLDGIIQGIDPGSGIMQLSESTLEAYGLEDYTLRSASAASMTAALSRAIENHQWIVVTGWTPHWMFGRWDLRFLQDPKGTMGGPQHIDAVVRHGFKSDFPDVATFLRRMHIPLDMLQRYMHKAQQTSYEHAVQKFLKEQKALVNQWLKKP